MVSDGVNRDWIASMQGLQDAIQDETKQTVRDWLGRQLKWLISLLMQFYSHINIALTHNPPPNAQKHTKNPIIQPNPYNPIPNTKKGLKSSPMTNSIKLNLIIQHLKKML